MWQPEIYDLKKEYGDLARSYSDSMIKIQTYDYGLDHELSKSNPGIFNDVANSDLVLTKTCQCGGHLHQGTSVSREPEIFRVKKLICYFSRLDFNTADFTLRSVWPDFSLIFRVIPSSKDA